MSHDEKPPPCQTCQGCGKLADDDTGTPWSVWLDLPLQSSAAVLMGLVKPVACTDCGGSGDDDVRKALQVLRSRGYEVGKLVPAMAGGRR